MPSKVWDEITYPFPNFNAYTVEVWTWMGNSILHFIIDITTYPGINLIHTSEWDPGRFEVPFINEINE